MLNVEPTVWPNVSDPTNPLKVKVVVAVLLPSYVLLAVDAVAVKAFTATTTLTFSGLVGSETLGQTVGSTFDNKNVGTGKSVTVNSITLADGTGLAANYSISPGQTTTADVTAKALTVSASTSNKIYDATTLANTTLTLNGLIGSETLNVTGNSTFDNKNIGSGKTVTVNSITLANGTNGGLAANYSVATGQTTTATVTAKPLIVSGITASSKSYDTTTSASLNTSSLSYNGLVAGDDFTGSFTGTFSNADIGTGKLITLTPTFSGSDVTNYSITNHPNVYAYITIGNPSISGLSDHSIHFRDLSYTLAGISSISGLPITYTSSNTEVATVSNTGAVTILDVGTATITANISCNVKL